MSLPRAAAPTAPGGSQEPCNPLGTCAAARSLWCHGLFLNKMPFSDGASTSLLPKPSQTFPNCPGTGSQLRFLPAGCRGRHGAVPVAWRAGRWQPQRGSWLSPRAGSAGTALPPLGAGPSAGAVWCHCPPLSPLGDTAEPPNPSPCSQHHHLTLYPCHSPGRIAAPASSPHQNRPRTGGNAPPVPPAPTLRTGERSQHGAAHVRLRPLHLRSTKAALFGLPVPQPQHKALPVAAGPPRALRPAVSGGSRGAGGGAGGTGGSGDGTAQTSPGVLAQG